VIQIQRGVLDAKTMLVFTKKTAKIESSADPSSEALLSWNHFRGKARQALVKELTNMASGLQRCIYCEDSMGTDVDHFAPKSTYPALTFDWNNHFLACSHCNSNLKRNQFPLDALGRPLLVNPVLDDPRMHLAWSPSTGEYTGRDDKGKVSIKIFGLNNGVRPQGRIDAWYSACALVNAIDELEVGDPEAQQYLTALRNRPFTEVFRELVLLSHSDSPLVPRAVSDAIRRREDLNL